MLLFEQEKGSKMRAIYCGFRDAPADRFGPWHGRNAR